jgi:hypothetical protein
MATTYYVNFSNQTGQPGGSGTTYTFGVFQTIPNMQPQNLQSVSWLQSTVPPSGSSGVSFQLTYNALLANYSQTGGKGVYSANQNVGSPLGTAWKVVYQNGVQQLVPYPDAPVPPPADTISIFNASGLPANPGIGMSGAGSVYTNNVLSGAGSYFQVTPTYYVSAYTNLVLGEVISSVVGLPAQQIKFNAPYNAANVVLSVVGSTISMNITYSVQASFAGLFAKVPSKVLRTSYSIEGAKDQSVLEKGIDSHNFQHQAAQKGLFILNSKIANNKVVVELAQDPAVDGGKKWQETFSSLLHTHVAPNVRLNAGGDEDNE